MITPSTIWILSGLGLSALPLHAGTPGAVAQNPPGLRVEVTPEGAFYRQAPAVPDRTPPGHRPLIPGGLIWSHPDGGLAWIGDAVALGNFGSEVFTEYDLNNQRAELFSVYDTNPPTAIWTDTTPIGSDLHRVASAEATNTKVSIHVFNPGTASSSVVVSKYSTSGAADWTYIFPFSPSGDGGTHVGISRNGQTIVALAGDPGSGTAYIAVFSPSSGTPVSYTPFSMGVNNQVRGFDLSADGSTLYFATSASATAYIFDIATTTMVFSQFIGASFDSHAIGGDGSVFAFGNFNTMSLYERVGTFYTNTYTRTIPGQCYCGYIDISDDNSTVAYGYTFYSNYLPVQIEAVDIPTHTVTMSDVVTASGSFQNIVSAVSISANGQNFAVGLWGDGSGPVEEARYYSRNQNAPVGTVNLPGSVFGIAISADGQRMVSGSKSVHANQFGNGGSIDLWGAATPFTHFCSGDGSLATQCPCANSGMFGHGCENSSGTQGALLTATGSTSPDTVVLTSSSERATAFTLFVQGNSSSASGISYGDGIRCVTGALKRIGAKTASGGTASYPGAGDPSISARSAALGDPIAPGSTRYYQSYYRDPTIGFCPPQTFNVSSGVVVVW
jgi:hypothetical protein